MTRIGYLVHDLADPAVRRRVAMLEAGDADIVPAGFVREGRAVPVFETAPLVLGETRDARLAARAAAVARVCLARVEALAEQFGDSDVLMARNLEMLAIAVRVVRRIEARTGRRPRLVYECLDIHRLLTSEGVAGRALRALERRLAHSVDLAITSSPAFVRNHLGAVFGSRTLVVENKVPALTDDLTAAGATPPGPPWRIGWFGALRCRKSFEILSDLARRGDGQVEVVLRGRPTPAVFPDLAAEVREVPNMRFEGAYDGARDLPEIYGDVHFSWCIDFYEEGHNSAWLLPNRLYESAFHATLPIALAHVETGAFLDRNGFGVTVDTADAASLWAYFAALKPADYAAQIARLEEQPRALWSVTVEECAALVRALATGGAAQRFAASGHEAGVAEEAS